MLTLNEDTSVKIPVIYFDSDDDFYKFCVLPQMNTEEYIMFIKIIHNKIFFCL